MESFFFKIKKEMRYTKILKQLKPKSNVTWFVKKKIPRTRWHNNKMTLVRHATVTTYSWISCGKILLSLMKNVTPFDTIYFIRGGYACQYIVEYSRNVNALVTILSKFWIKWLNIRYIFLCLLPASSVCNMRFLTTAPE